MKHSYWTFTVRNINNNISWKTLEKNLKNLEELEFSLVGNYCIKRMFLKMEIGKNDVRPLQKLRASCL